MIVVLHAFVASQSLRITPENFTSILTNLTNGPVFLMLWASWCLPCKAISQTWHSLSNLTRASSHPQIADIDCVIYPKLCSPFHAVTYPQFFWLEPGLAAPIPYFGSPDAPGFLSFIDRQLTFSIEPIHTPITPPAFVFSIPPDAPAAAHVHARAIAERFRHTPAVFLQEESDELRLSVFTAPDRRVFSKSGFYAKQLDDFIVRHSVPFLAPLTPPVTALLAYHGQPFFAFLANHTVDADIAQAAAEHLPVVVAPSAGEEPWTVFERRSRRFWLFHGDNRSAKEVGQWAAGIANGSVAAERPGIGVFGRLFDASRERAEAGEERALMHSALSVIAVLTVAAAIVDGMLKQKGSLSPLKRKEE
jgi:thiol-disulfide isomerase/thioredoxin